MTGFEKLAEAARSTNVLDNVYAVTLPDMALLTLLAFGMGLYILWVYRRVYDGAMCSGTFAVSLVALCMITTTLILAVTSNLVLSLGMVGALSIVRFRTAIKDPMEIVFLFWSIETGIVLAAGVIPMAVFVNLAIGIVLILLIKQRPDYPYILVIRCTRDAVKDVGKVLDEKTESYIVRSRKSSSTASATGRINGSGGAPQDEELIEMDIEVVLKSAGESQKSLKESEFVDTLHTDAPGVKQAILVTYNGGYMN